MYYESVAGEVSPCHNYFESMQAIKFIPYVIYAVRVPQNVNYC